MPDDVQLLERRQQPETDAVARLLQGCAEPLPEPERAEAFGALFDQFGDASGRLAGLDLA